MKLPGKITLLALAGLMLCAGCGSTTAPSAGAASARAAVPGPMSVAGSEATNQATWAVLPMGAQSGPNQFWQLFLLAAGSRQWKLDTPPDIATNGAPALAGLAGTDLVAGIRPSLYLDYSPISLTADAGKTWSAGPPAAGLASVPDALAGTPGGHQLLALSKSGEISTASVTGSGWRTLATEHSLATSVAGRACGLTAVTAVAYATPASSSAAAVATPLVGGDCKKPGVAGIFARSGSSWRAAGPTLPAALSGAPVRVLRLVASSAGTVALWQSGTGAAAQLMVGWRTGSGQWVLSPSFRLAGSGVVTAAFGAAGAAAVLLTDRKGATIEGPGSAWRQLPAVPAAPGATLALPADSPVEALTAAAGTLTVWQLAGTGAWARAAIVKVPIQYGSSE
ncbi:MAG TPA: hypothetical protein VMB74_05210 [Streptosporangiaceae bacterium]|nr:hypothetical protein [Streptosporangiaceae bacterium]